MSLPVFLHPDLSLAEIGQPVGLDGAEGRHAVTVKRMGPGEHLVLIDGSGRRATATSPIRRARTRWPRLSTTS